MELKNKLKNRVLSLSQQVIDRLFADDQRAKQLAKAIGKVQRGKAAFERGQDELMRQLSFAPRSDFKAVGKRLAGLKRRVRELEQKLRSPVDVRAGHWQFPRILIEGA